MLNSIAAGRQAALRAAGWQMAVAGLVALPFLLLDAASAAAAAVGGLAVVAGQALAATVALGGGVVPAGAALARLVLGAGLKWLVVGLVFAVALGVGRLPPLPLLIGLAAAVVAYPLILNFCVRDKT